MKAVGLCAMRLREDFDFPHSGGEQVEHVLDPDAHAPDARPSAALVRVEGDPVHNGMIITYGGWRVKGAGNTPVKSGNRQIKSELLQLSP